MDELRMTYVGTSSLQEEGSVSPDVGGDKIKLRRTNIPAGPSRAVD